MSTTPLAGRRGAIVIAVLALIVLFPLGFSAVSRVVVPGDAGPQPFLERPDPKFDRCVRDTTYMRFSHWELLRTVRDDTVRSGRPGEISLRRCRDCHASRERFCDRCHNTVSLYPDCWRCHYYP